MRTGTATAIAALAISAITIPLPVCAAEFHVSPNGHDSNPGTKAKPFRTVAKARDAVRALKQKGGHKILLRGGNYFLAETLEFDKRDSGTPKRRT